MKKKLNECKRRINKNFGFGSVLCAFFFERVPSLIPRETVPGNIFSFPTLCRWAALLPRQGAGRVQEAFDDKLFDWWAYHIPAIEDYPYTEINFLRDPYMPMSPSEERGQIGMHHFYILKLFNF
jgi:hypothetical protein